MAYTTIDKSTDYFNTKLYTGTGASSQAQTGVGFKPDFVWIKSRSSSEGHVFTDIVRGVTKYLISNTTSAQVTNTDTLKSFDSDGYTIGPAGVTGGNGVTFASMNWKANGQGSSNTAGSINTTYTSANTTAGFSIIQYTGNGSSGATIGHGLGVVPKVVIVKLTSGAGYDWGVYHASLGNTKNMRLNLTDTVATSSAFWNDTTPSSSLVTLGNNATVNGSGSTYIAYCFSEIQGFSKIGNYTGNGNNGSGSAPMIYTGFKPGFIILKRTDSADNWFIFDNKRKGYNAENDYLYANLTNGEGSTDILDIVSSGFKLRTTDSGMNAGGGSYIYIAFADNPFVTSTGVPTPAR